MIRRLIDRFRWWHEPGDVFVVARPVDGYVLDMIRKRPTSRVWVHEGTILVYKGVGDLLPPYTLLFATFTQDTIELLRMDIQHLRRLRRPLLDLT